MIERVVTDPKVLDWRSECFARLGFEQHESELLAQRAEVDTRDVEHWLGRGATHLQVLSIVAPL